MHPRAARFEEMCERGGGIQCPLVDSSLQGLASSRVEALTHPFLVHRVREKGSGCGAALQRLQHLRVRPCGIGEIRVRVTLLGTNFD